ncbi:hypothetical protein ONZ45_g8310 [Pleurotus djamor]|nr:hypothetical protein ONZ45_g8310 [Pleurotus djamor]
MSTSTGLYSLATIIKRLEAATSRIEDIVHAQDGSIRPAKPVEGGEPDFPAPSGPPSSSATPAPPAPPPPPAPSTPGPAEVPRSVLLFDEAIVDGKLKAFVELTKGFPSEALIEQVNRVEKQFQNLRSLLLMAASCQKPDAKIWGEVLSPLQADIEAITRLKEANRKDRTWFTHMSTVSEGAPCVGWVTVDLKPAPYVNDIKDSTLFYGNRVIKEFKEKDPKHAEWVRAYIALLEELRKYVLDQHTTGLVWNPKVRYSSNAIPG